MLRRRNADPQRHPDAIHARGVWQRLKPFVPKDACIVSVAKGIENDTLLRPTQIIADVLGGGKDLGRGPVCDWKLAALPGPNIAAELARYLPGTAVAAADDDAAGQARAGCLLHRSGFGSTPIAT